MTIQVKKTLTLAEISVEKSTQSFSEKIAIQAR